jgi:drug/metabolite transporter (DMT)-like permease
VDSLQQEKAHHFGLTDIMLISTAIIWGVNVVVVKLALVTMPPLVFNSLRFLLATALSWAALKWAEPLHKIRQQDLLTIVWLGLLGHTVYQVLFIFGINFTSAGNTSLLLATIPIWVALLSGLLALEKVSPFTWAGIVCSFLGIVLVVVGGGSAMGFALHTFKGDAMILTGTLLMAIYTIRSKPLLKDYSPLALSTYTMTSGTVGLLIIALPSIRAADFTAVDYWGWGGLLFSAIFALVVGYFVWNNGLRALGAARTAVYGNLSPVIAMLTSWAVLHESLTLAQLLGAMLIIGGLFLARMRLNKIATFGEGTKSV